MNFIDIFLTNYYWEKEFHALQSSLSLITILLKYHEPELYNSFENAMISPEIYATSWLLTLFANKCSLEVVYHLWDKIIVINDCLLIHYIVIALLIKHKQTLINDDTTQLPITLSKIKINSIDEVDDLIAHACDLCQCTPNSFRIFANKLEIFKYHSQRLKQLNENYEPENIIAMPIFPSELISITYKSDFGCCDTNCVNFDLRKKEKNVKNISSCIYCQRGIDYRKKNNKISFLILDLRLYDKILLKNNKHNEIPGYLPLSVNVEEKDLVNETYPNNIINKFCSDNKTQYHCLLVTSQTDYFKEYENKYYYENGNDNNYFSSLFGNVSKVEKELNLEKVELNLHKLEQNPSLHLKLKEFDNLKKIISFLLKEKYPYVSYMYGGFNEMHLVSHNYNVQLIGHGENCYLCSKQKSIFYSRFLNIMKVGFNSLKGKFISQECKDDISILNGSLFNKRELSIKEIGQLLKEPRIIQYTCLYKSHYDLGVSASDIGKENTLLIFIYLKKVFIYQEHKEMDSENLVYILIRDIDIENIKKLIPKQHCKNIIMILYEEPTGKCEYTISMEFGNEIDARDFKIRIQKLINNTKLSL